jgi:hypothetical protein
VNLVPVEECNRPKRSPKRLARKRTGLEAALKQRLA